MAKINFLLPGVSLIIVLSSLLKTCSCQAKAVDSHFKCSDWEAKYCLNGVEKFHYCTTTSAPPDDLKQKLFGLPLVPGGGQPSKLYCECREGFTIPLYQAYEENYAPLSQCIPCQDENLVYFGFNLPGYDPIIASRTVDECRLDCYKTAACNFWTFNRVSQKCYLKSRRGAATSDNKYVSGVKNCSGPNFFLERKDLSNTLPLLEMFHPTGERSVLQGVPASFGPRLAGDFMVLGYLSGTYLQDLFCENLSPVYEPKGEVAIIRRGRCPFLQKIQVAQLAGFKGVIILDDDSNARFNKIIAAKEDQHKSKFIKIPTIFLRVKETEVFERLIATGKKFLVRLSGSDNFSPIRDGSDIKFPEKHEHEKFDPEPKHEIDNEIEETNNNKNNATHYETGLEKGEVTEETPNPQVLSVLESGFSPVAIVFIVAISGLVALALLTVLGLMCRKVYQRPRINRETSRCQGSTESNSSNGTIFQTVSSSNTGSLEALARWIGSENFQTAGSDSAEMAVILSSVECPVCYEAIWPPKKIFQCSKGHILCETCLGNAFFDQRCPSCRESFTTTRPSRNLALENLFASVLQLANTLDRNQSTSTNPTAANATPVAPPAAPDFFSVG